MERGSRGEGERAAQLAEAMIGQGHPSPLATDAYKFSMAQVGWPLRPETFYLSFRRSGWYYLPFALDQVISRLLPREFDQAELKFLGATGYAPTTEMRAALRGQLKVEAPAAGSWVCAGEPIVSLSGPSFLVSWLEALCIWLHYPIQVASAALVDEQRLFVCSSPDQGRIASLALEAVGLETECQVRVDREAFSTEVHRRALELRAVLGGDVDHSDAMERLFEVGMRGATCMQGHRDALRAAQRAGLTMSSNLLLAKEEGLVPVGTTGHEHQLRFASDLDAFRAIRDGRRGPPSYLFDSYDAHRIGIPAAVHALRETPGAGASVRFDSGDTEAQIAQFLEAGVEPVFIFMDGMRPERIRAIEAFCEARGVARQHRRFGVGGYLVAAADAGELTRDRVSAVYKLCESGGRPVMKFSNAGKESLPGRLSILRRRGEASPYSLLAQRGEEVEGYQTLACVAAARRAPTARGSALSPKTIALVASLRSQHQISEAKNNQL